MFQDDPPWPPSAPPPSPASSPEEGRRWRLADILVGTALLILGFIVAIAAGAVLVSEDGLDRRDPQVALIFAIGTLLVEVWIGVVVVLLARRRGITFTDLGFRMPRNWSGVPLAVAGAWGCLFLYGVGVLLVEQLTGRDLSFIREGNPIPEDLAQTPLIWTLLGLSVVVAAPLSEELFFRGLIYRGVAGLAGPTVGMVASGVAFAVVHANVSVVLPFAAIGMIFARVYRSSGSLWTTIAAHAIFNGVSFVLTVYGVGS